MKNIFNDSYPIPIFVCANKNGTIESIIMANKPYVKHAQIDLTKLNARKIQNVKHPTKFVFLLQLQ